MIAAPVSASPFSHLPERTWAMLENVGVGPAPLDAEWSQPDDAEFLANVSTRSWEVGPTGRVCGECRILHIQGKNEEIVHTLIYPTHPDRMPLFWAMLWQSNTGCHASIDLATPGMLVPIRDEVWELSAALSIRHAAFLPRSMATPNASRCFSPNALLVREQGAENRGERMAQAYEDYLNVWLDFASALPERMTSNAPAQRELLHYKRQLETQSPGQEVFHRLIGEEWTSRFCAEFLYR